MILLVVCDSGRRVGNSILRGSRTNDTCLTGMLLEAELMEGIVSNLKVGAVVRVPRPPKVVRPDSE